MKHSEFSIGAEFRCNGEVWRCTDIGSRTIVAIGIRRVVIKSCEAIDPRTMYSPEARARGLFNGPPYAVQEIVFDEYDIEACYLDEEA